MKPQARKSSELNPYLGTQVLCSPASGRWQGLLQSFQEMPLAWTRSSRWKVPSSRVSKNWARSICRSSVASASRSPGFKVGGGSETAGSLLARASEFLGSAFGAGQILDLVWCKVGY